MRDNGLERHIGEVLLLLLAIGCFVILRPFLSALLWAAVLSFATWPIYVRLERLLGGRKTLAATAMVALTAAMLLLPLVALGLRLASEVADLTVVVRGWMEDGLPRLPAWAEQIPVVGPRLGAYWQSVAENGGKLVADISAYAEPARDWLLGTAMRLGAGTTELALSLIISFFLYRDGMAGLRAVRLMLRRLSGGRAEHLMQVTGSTVKGVVYGVLGTNVIEALLASVGFWLAGVPGALLLGCAVFFLTLVPAAPAVVFIPAILWLLHRDAMIAAIFLAAWYFVVFMVLEGVLRAYLISRGSNLPVILVFLGMLGGIFVFGLLGIFVGPTLLAVGYALVQEWSGDGVPGAEMAEAEEDPRARRLPP